MYMDTPGAHSSMPLNMLILRKTDQGKGLVWVLEINSGPVGAGNSGASSAQIMFWKELYELWKGTAIF